MELCTDRSQGDVDQLQALSEKIGEHGIGSLTAAERLLWFRGDGSMVYTSDQQTIEFADGALMLGPLVIRGAYNTADLERVEGAMRYLAEQFRGLGFEVRADFPSIRRDPPREEDMARYLRNLSALRGVLTLYPTTPQVPKSMAFLTWREANDIEQILLDIEPVMAAASRVFRHSGAAISGMGGLIR